MALIRANRESIDDRFSVLGFTVRTENPLFEIGLATDPELLKAENRQRRTASNFFSSRVLGAPRAPQGKPGGEAVYLVPPNVVARFVGQPRLYFGLATYQESDRNHPATIKIPDRGNMYVNLAGLTERGLRRTARLDGAGAAYGRDGPALDWGGDALAAAGMPAARGNGNGNAAPHANGNGNGNGAASAPTPGAAAYSDGYSADLWERGAGETPPLRTRGPEPGTSSPIASAPNGTGAAPANAAPASTSAPATAQAFNARTVIPGRMPARTLEADEDPADSLYGIDGPVPDQASSDQAGSNQASSDAIGSDHFGYRQPGADPTSVDPGADFSARAQSVRAFDAAVAEYPGASRFAAAHASNYRARSTPRDIQQLVIHITDGGSKITGTIGWFQNPDQRNARNQPIHVSAHYVIGQDGEVVQMVRNQDVAWHASSANSHSVGIEHVANKRGLNPTDAQYEASAALVAWLCAQTGLPADREHIRGHYEASPRDNHDCPSAIWNWDRYMECVRLAVAAAAPASGFAQGLGAPASASARQAYSRAQEIIRPYYDPSTPASALTCQADAFSLAREEWFVGVDSTRAFPHSAICQINTTDSAGQGWGGTGFYIGRNRILTCAHNLHGMVDATVIPGKNGGEQPFGQCKVAPSSWRVAPGYTGSGNWANDLAVIDNVPIAAPGGRWFEFLNATPSDRLSIVVCGYSGASDAVPELTQAIDGDKQHLHGGYANGQSNPEVIEYPILTLHGASGSPVYHLDDGSGTLQAKVCAVHVTGQPAAQGLNRGCFITPNKIDWIEGRATAFALDAPTALRTRRAPAVTPGRRGVVQLSPGSRAQGFNDLLTVDLKIRVFIPAPAAMVTVPGIGGAMPLQSAHGGDGRGFQLTGGSSRAEVAAQFHFGGEGAATQLTGISRNFGQSANYAIDDTVAVAGKPEWYRDLRPGARATETGSQAVSDDKLRIELGGSSFHGILSMAENAAVVTFNLHASDPIVTGAPDIDATLALLIKLDGERVKVRVNGGHDEFPAYEIYANGVLVYSYDPIARGGTPWGLFGDGNWDVNPDSDYVDVGPAREFHVVGPVRIGAAQGLARPLEIPLDPGIGGQSIGIDALAAGDIIVSTARAAVSYAIRAGTLSAVSHAMLYVGNGNVVEAVGDGVREVPLGTAIDDAMLAVAYRDPRVDAGKAALLVEFARSRVGQPYNYGGVARTGYRIVHPLAARVLDAIRDLAGVDDTTARSFYCSELVFAAFEAAGIALVAQRADVSTPDDVVQLTRGSLAYVGHLKARDELLGIAMALTARSLGSDDIDLADVALIPQPDKNACWAASMAMLLSWRRRASFAPETLANEVGASLAGSYSWELLDAVRERYGFSVIPQPSNASVYHTPRQWAQWLRDYGALWVVIVGAPHAVVLAGIRGNLDEPASVQVKVLNPWDTRVGFDNDELAFHPANQGYQDWLSFQDFAADFGNMAQADYGNWRVLHLPAGPATAQGLGVARGSGAASTRHAPSAAAGSASRGSGIVAREMAIPALVAEEAVKAATAFIVHQVLTPAAPGQITATADKLDAWFHPGGEPRNVAASESHFVDLSSWPVLHGAPLVPSPDLLPDIPDGQTIHANPSPDFDPQAYPRDLKTFQDFIVRWGSDGASVGAIYVEPRDGAAMAGTKLDITATIELAPALGPRETPAYARVDVVFRYVFTDRDNRSHLGETRVVLYGNGTSDKRFSWIHR